ncbi:hypothetical protein A9264_09625 [Vibrio sp. UCD-FRSSP16_10]|uniref:sensor domain-containing diguanylate cyclase n=1 Tax=unclassified Vibrio TaxID=2614977 RepID=UPI0008012C33|nr:MULTISPECIES: diguanylate cyclase [unclassified Vibrio]OBT16977.1 hypothetical protein A9260_09850 [Vibrio sp. UCD-FRSSP16_30]OBT21968.1 hypothetical protein A9264_09625 [Vibrio sp. UCD-FRSSP16_10]
MALPRTIIRLLRPYVVVLIAILIYVAYQHYLKVEKDVISQSHANLRTATKLIQKQFNSTKNTISSLNYSSATAGITATNQQAINLVNRSENYNDILRYNTKTHQLLSELQINAAKQRAIQPKPIGIDALRWTDIQLLQNDYQVSNVYQSYNERWVIAIREKHPRNKIQYIIEYDLWAVSQALIDLQPMNAGNVFVVDRTTGQILLHPDPNRIGKSATVYKYAIAGKVVQEIKSGPVSHYFSSKPTYQFSPNDNILNKHRSGHVSYYYGDIPKLAVYSARNNLNWVYFSTTNRSSLLSHSYSVTLIVVLAMTLLLMISAYHYINGQLQFELKQLKRSSDLLEFKNNLTRLLSRFCSRNRIQLCLYNYETHAFYSIDYQGEESLLINDKKYAINLLNGELTYIRNSQNDRLARAVQLDKAFYRLPLMGHKGLLGVIFIEHRTQTYSSLMKLLQTYIETALSNVMLHRQLSLRDSATNQDNLLTLRNKISRYKGHTDIYLLTIDVDDLKQVNYQYGYTCGDQLILEMTQIIGEHFPVSSTLSTARSSGDEFCILYQASDQHNAYTVAENLRNSIAKHRFKFDKTDVSFTVSIGISHLLDSSDKTLATSLQATDKAKKKGKNMTIMSMPD